jgi:nucleotide-binding universal stress UspA family protein
MAFCMLLAMTACAGKYQETVHMPTVSETTEAAKEPVPETAEPTGSQLLDHPEAGKVCVSFLPTESGGDWKYAVIEDQEAALAAFEKATGAIYSDEWWIKGDRTLGLTVVYGDYWDFVESGELVYALGRVKAENAAELYELCAETAKEAGWKETVSPERLKGIVSATLRQGEKEIPLTDAAALAQLEAMLSGGTYALGGTGCPFTALLDLELETGEMVTVALATDSCGVWMSEGYYYEFATDSQILYDLFGVTLEFGNIS